MRYFTSVMYKVYRTLSTCHYSLDKAWSNQPTSLWANCFFKGKRNLWFCIGSFYSKCVGASCILKNFRAQLFFNTILNFSFLVLNINEITKKFNSEIFATI